MIVLPATTGVGEVPDGWNGSAYSHVTVPSSGFSAMTRSVVMNTTSGTAPRVPAAANRTGEDVPAGSSMACHWTSPVSASKATTELPLPPTAATTRLPTTRGEQQTP